MKKHLLILCFLLTAIAAQAQVPGYRGKRFMLGYAVVPTVNYSGIEEKGVFIYPAHVGRIEYVLTRKASAGLVYQTASVPNPNRSVSDFKYNIIAIDIRSTMGSHNAVAPLGSYVNAKLLYGMYHIQFAYDNEIDKVGGIGFGIGLGRTRIFLNRIVMDLGGELMLTPNSFMGGMYLPKESAWNSAIVSEITSTNNLLTFRLGVSGLLF